MVTAATAKLSGAELIAAIASANLTKEEQKSILMKHGLSDAELEAAMQTLAHSTANTTATATTGTLTTATGGLSAAFRGLTVAIASNPIGAIAVAITTVIGIVSTAITVFSNFSDSIEDTANDANELKQSFEDIDSYISRINELKIALSDNNISQSEAIEKREELLTIQEELLDKYGKEKDAVENITKSIQGETSALIELKKEAAKNWNDTHFGETKEANQYFNDDKYIGVAWGHGQQISAKKWINQWANDNGENIYISPNSNGTQVGFKGNIDTILANMDDLHNAIENKIKEYESKENLNWYEQQELQGFKELKIQILETKSELLNSDEYKNNKTIYDTAVENLILANDKYSQYYEEIVKKKKAYTEALASGNQDEIIQAYNDMHDLFNTIFSLDFLDEDNVSGESIKSWFEGVKQQIELQSKETPIIIDIQAELKDTPDGYNNKIKEIAAKNNYTSADIREIMSKGNTGEVLSGDEKTIYDSVTGYVNVWNDVAESTGQAELKVEGYIDILEKLGIVQEKIAEGSESSFVLSKDQTKELKSVHSDIDKLNKAYQNLFAGKLTTNDVVELVDLFPILGEYVDWTDEKFGNLAEGIDKVIKERPSELIEQLESILNTQDLSDEARQSIQSMIAALKQLKPELNETETLLEKIQKAIKGVSSSISTLIGFTKEISSDGALSLSSIDTIMTDDTYKSLRPYINDMEGMQTAITELVAKQKDAYEDLYNAEMYEKDSEAYHKAVQQKEQENENLLSDSIKQIEDEIKYFNDAYGIDITNWDNLSEAKKATLQNTNAELLSKQGKLIKDFGQLYNDDITNFSNAIKAKAEIQKHFEESQVYSKINSMIDNDPNSVTAYDINTGKITGRYASQETQAKITDLLSTYGLTYADYANYRDYGKFTQSGNEALEKVLDEFIKPYTITDNDWKKMTANIKSTGSSGSSSSSKNYIDWIERRLKKFAQTTKEVFAKVADYISFNNQNSQLRKAINAIRDEIAVNEQSYQYYMDEANKVGLDPYWQWFVQNGARNISDIQDEVLREKISRYTELYDKATDCKNAVEDLRKTEKEYANQMLSNVEKYYSNRITYANADAEYYNSLDTDNLFLNKNYNAIRKSYNEQISYTQKQHDDFLNTLNSLVSSGSIKYQSDEWYEWWGKIQKCDVEVRNLKKSIHDLASEELQNIQGYWDNRIGVYDNTISYLNTLSGDTTRKGSKNYKGLSSAYNSEIGYTKKQVSDLQTRLDKAVKAGDIEKYSDKWYEWTGVIEQGKEKVVELQTSIHQLAVDEFNDIATKYDNLINKIEHKNSLLEESITQTQEKGYIVSTKYYNSLIQNEQKNISQLTEKRNELYSNLQKAIKSGNIEEGSEEWHKMFQEIESVDLEIKKANTSVVKFNNSIRDIEWQVFDLLQDRISQITQESNFLVNLMKNDKLYIKDGQSVGQLTNKGLSTIGLHGVNYNVYMAQSNKYAEEILNIDKQLAKDPYNQDLINRRKELLKLQQDMILSANDEKQAIVNMVKEGIDLELNALKDLIDKYNEALDVQKDLYDYQKRVKEQTKEITSLQKQLMAYANDSSEETKAKVQQLKVNLETAKENLQETQYDKFINDQKKLLDGLYDDYENIVNQRLDNVDSLISDMIVDINNNANIIKQTLIDEAGNVGYQISSTMNNIWNSGTRPVLSEYNNNFLNSSNNVIAAINSLTSSINNMITALNKTANNNESVKTSSKQSTTTTNKSTTTNKNNITKSTNTTNNGKNNTNGTSSGLTKGNTNGTSSGLTKGNTNGTSSRLTKGNTNGNTTNNSTSKQKTTRTDKDNYGVALAIWDGNYGWGAGSTRANRLKAKGFDANKVQSIVNKMANDGYVFTGAWVGKYYGIKDLSPYHYNKFKQGTYAVKHNQLGWTNENGLPEVIVRPSDGAILTPLAKDDMILNSYATDNLFSMANDPAKFIKDNLFSGNSYADTSNINNVSSNCSVSVDTINFNLPNVKNYEEFFYAAQHDKRFEKMVQAMTVDKLFGGSSLKKYRV